MSDGSVWRNRSFVAFLAGQFATNAGDSLYTVALLWLTLQLTGSSAVVGAVNAILLLPWLLQALAGPFVDRLSLRPLLVGSQLTQGAVVLALPLAYATGRLTVGVILGVATTLMVASLVMAPMESALLPRIVADSQLSRANSALATVTLGLDMVFDAVGGAFIAVFGATTLFLVDAGTFALAAVLFATVTVAPLPEEADEDDTADADTPRLREYLADLRVGVDTLRGTAFVELTALTAFANFTTGVTLAILPAFGASLDGAILLGVPLDGAVIYGAMLGALGIGRLVGSVLGPRFETVPYGRFSIAGNAVSGVAWLASVLAPGPALTVGLFGLAWVPVGISGVLSSTLRQQLFPTEVLGRVSAVKGTASGATLPLGSLVGGVVGTLLGIEVTLALAALGFGLAAPYLAVRKPLRGLPSVSEAEPADFGL
ncbi:MFS transporter [Halosegnis rubeus]|jgi:MFS family permease|uniref:MFS transporter n=1 Tax=Halosegnis rubeus TaxID=2212850 RepID=A0A5N5UH87_9EURY|nr:MFS transporter [Halosegnis rubeus]KAB7518048.1 MFS transporter [Halosegnis rubeus]